MAHVNRQYVCSVEPALATGVRRCGPAGSLSLRDTESMFAVRMRLSRSRRELSSTCIEPLDERMGSQSPGAAHAPYAHRVPQSESQIVSLAAGATRPVSGA